MNKESLTQSQLKSYLHYDPISGMFHKIRCGLPLNTPSKTKSDKEYIYISVLGHKHIAHRLAWLYIYGYFPNEIDHEDGNGLNNKIDNLRDVSHAENSKNLKHRKDNTSGVMGVIWFKQTNKWRAQIMVNQKTVYLGYYKNFNDAIIARKMAEYELGFHANHGGKV